MRRRGFETAFADFDELFLVVGDAAARTAHREGRTDDHRETDHRLHLLRFLHRMRRCRARRAETDLGHRRLELLAILGLVDRLLRSADHLDAEFVQHAILGEVERAVECGLPAHRRQQRIGPLLFDDLFDDLPGDRLDVGHIRHFRIGHDRRRVGVHQDDAVALLTQRLAGLRAGIVEFAGLADDDRASTNDENALEICTLGHELLSCSLLVLHQLDETVEQVGHVVRAWARFGVSLEGERRDVSAGNALQ